MLEIIFIESQMIEVGSIQYRIENEKCLRNGKSERIFVGIDTENNDEVAIKLVCKKEAVRDVMIQENNVATEFEALSKIDHENVLKVIGVNYNVEVPEIVDSSCFALAMESVKGGDLNNLLFKYSRLNLS